MEGFEIAVILMHDKNPVINEDLIPGRKLKMSKL